jgi:hypothetical protein
MTNQHVVRAARNLRLHLVDGQDLNPTGIELASEQDAVRITIQETDVTPVALNVSTQLPRIGQHVRIFGNSDGMGVVTELEGRVLGVGPATIEVDAGFVRGNSGSPVVDDSGSVIGIATFVVQSIPQSDWVLDGTRFERTRRFGLRTDKDLRWVPTTLDAFYQQTRLLDDAGKYLLSVIDLLYVWTGTRESSEAGADFVAFAKDQKKGPLAASPWRQRFVVFVRAYKAYWDIRNQGVVKKSMTRQTAKTSLQRQMETLPFEPQVALQTTRWLTPSLKQESVGLISAMGVVSEKLREASRPGGPFWRNYALGEVWYVNDPD